MIRLVVTDIDDTLVCRERRVITKRGQAAMHALIDAGVVVGPATGRDIYRVGYSFRFDHALYSTAVVANGMKVYYQGEKVLERELPLEGLAKVAKLCTTDERAGLLLFGAVVIIYTSLGGFKAVVITDTIQGFIMACGTFLLLFFVMITISACVGQLACEVGSDGVIRTACCTGDNLNAGCIEGRLGTFAEAAADQDIHVLAAEQLCKVFVADTVRADHIARCHLSILCFIIFKGFCTAEVLKNLAVLIRYCYLHNSNLR